MPKTRNQISDQTFDHQKNDDMLNDLDMITGDGHHQPNEMLFIDGQKSTTLANNIGKMTHADFEMVLLHESKINGRTIVTSTATATTPCNSINVNSMIGHCNDNAQQQQQSPQSQQLNQQNDNNQQQTLIPSSNPLQSSSFDSKANSNLSDSQCDNIVSFITPGHKSMNNSVSDDKLDTATADVIINEYPSECFPEPMYKYCPWCLDETPFWIRWKDIRTRCYKFVEHSYFETLVITLILISSMALVSLEIFFDYSNFVDLFFFIFIQRHWKM